MTDPRRIASPLEVCNAIAEIFGIGAMDYLLSLDLHLEPNKAELTIRKWPSAPLEETPIEQRFKIVPIEEPDS